MSYYSQQQAPQSAAYPMPGQAYPQPTEGYPTYVTPPPVGYPPMKDGAGGGYPQQVPVETRSRGGFWEGCCAALCCCCVLDMCF